MTGSPGTVVGNYRLVRELGVGGMGAVCEAVDLMLERPVAIKMLRPEIARQPELIDRFRVEAVTLARLSHPSIATLYSFFREREEYYMVMEFVRGQTLEAMLAGGRKLAPETAADVLRQALDGMAHAHEIGVLHRDIKPANIMVNANGTVKVMDFGIARILGSSRMTREGRIIGTLEYIAPERIKGEEADIRSDLYSAGVVLYEALAGRLPFVSDTDYGMIQAHLKEAPPPLRKLGVDCPARLEAVLRRALAKLPAERFQRAEEFRDALAGAVSWPAAAPAPKPTRLAGAEPALAETRVVPAARKLPAKWLAAGAGFVVVVAAGLFALIHSREAAPAPQPAAAADARPATPQPEPVAREVVREVVREPAASSGSLPPAFEQPRVQLPPMKIPEAAAPAEPAAAAKPSAPQTIRGVRRLYVAKMADGLDRYIRDEIRKQLPGRLVVVADPEEADAVMEGRGERHDGTASKLTSGYMGMKAKFTGSVSIAGAEGSKVLWESEAGDNSAIIGVLKRGGPKKVAERLVSNLKKAIEGK